MLLPYSVSRACNQRRADESIAHLLASSTRYDRLVPRRLGEVDMKRVVIVGGGLAGLSAGYRLYEQGCYVTVPACPVGRAAGADDQQHAWVTSGDERGFAANTGQRWSSRMRQKRTALR
jgi:hypothetical protein